MVSSEPVKQIEIMDPTKKDKIQCFDPSTKQRLHDVAMTPHKSTRSVSYAQQRRGRNYLAQRRAVLRTIQKYIVHH
jgi:hypothetical protein